MLKSACFVINLERSPQRLQRIKSQLDDQRVAFSRLLAVDGVELLDSDVTGLYSFDDPDAHYKQLNKGEIGCYLSHINAWQAIVDQQLDYAIILEDDVKLTGDINKLFDVVNQMPKDWDYIKMAEHSRKRRVEHRQSFADFERITYSKVPARTCAQIVSFEGAKKLLAYQHKILRPIDIDLQYWWEKDLRIFGLMPYLAEPNEDFGSDIDAQSMRMKASRKHWRKFIHAVAFLLQNRKFTQRRLGLLNKKQ